MDAAKAEISEETEAANSSEKPKESKVKKKKKASSEPESTLEGREGWGKLSTRNVLDAVEKAKDITLAR